MNPARDRPAPADPLIAMSVQELRAERNRAQSVLASCEAKGRPIGARSMREYLQYIRAELRTRNRPPAVTVS